MITPGQPATNPRMVKEAVALSEKGYKVAVVYCFWTAWATLLDKSITRQYPDIKWIKVAGDPDSSPAYYYFTRLRHKVYQWMYRAFPGRLSYAVKAETRGYNELVAKARKIKADLYIAHNLGALPAAAEAAKKHNAHFGFDAEDFHRGMVKDDSEAYCRTLILENSFLPSASLLTAASPLIAAKYSTIYSKPFVVLNNVFPKSLQPAFKELTNETLKMIWFSQTVGLNRGLEDVLQAVNQINKSGIELTIVGQCRTETAMELEKILSNKQHRLQFVDPLAEAELIEVCSQHHVGLALERNEPINRNICLTNKLFTYLLAGNAVIASDTEAQKQFLQQNFGAGFVYPIGDLNGLKSIITNFIANPALVTQVRNEAYRLAAATFNWEREKEKFLQLVENVLN